MPVVIPGSETPVQPGTLPGGYYQKPFPNAGVTVPSLAPYQFWFNEYTFGYATALELKKLDGISLPSVRSGDSGRPRDHGLFTGLDVMGGREITIEGDLKNDSVSFEHAWLELAAATIPGGSIEAPLYMNLPGFGTLVSMCRIRKRSMPVDIQLALGKLGSVALLFAGSDPRWYGTPTQLASVEAASTATGFRFPLGFPLSFGGGSVAGVVNVNNAGNFETRPILMVEGPCSYPSITNASLEGAPTLTFNITMAAGDKLIIGTDMHTATYYTAGTTSGSSRLNTLALGSQWFTCHPGNTEIQFSSQTGEGKLTVESASAYLL